MRTLAGLMAVLLLAGCFGDGDGRQATSPPVGTTGPPTAPPSTSPSSTASPAPIPTPSPPVGQEPAECEAVSTAAEVPAQVAPPFWEDFETGLANWSADADVPDDPNNPGSKVAWSITQGDNGWEDHVHIQAHPTHGARLCLDGRQDDGTIWLETRIAVQPGRAYLVNVSLRAWSTSESFNTLAWLVAYTGVEDPETEEDFPEPGHRVESGPAGGVRDTLNQVPGWLEYQYEWTSPVLQEGTLWAAIGISAVWESRMTYDIDAIRITATPV